MSEEQVNLDEFKIGLKSNPMYPVARAFWESREGREVLRKSRERCQEQSIKEGQTKNEEL